MARKPKPPEHPNHERWLVSYADFMTLLFAFFVMMYANSQTNKEQATRISQAFREALQEGTFGHALSRLLKNEPGQTAPANAQPVVVLPSMASKQRPVELLPSLHQLNETLKKEIASGRLEVRMERRGLVISLKEATFFPSGGDMLDPKTLPMLEVIANEIRKYPNPIRLEGHTDSIPISTSRFRSNWDLSAARGIAMLELFAERFGLDRSRMAISGFADTAPVASNETDEGRRRNRRVDIVVLNELAAAEEPVQGGAGAKKGNAQ
ncbi:flagellar motor protein MotB [uncultured Paludibaculum sp.]|uniref:flagellar motor protein MotB n=1 Tax=uncultured Paludibaculum sp. TaxID=1765020 RepID=UPI002AABB5B9|nr:flagellar motor protein MotB [uncultured Paludibaculum sp.]